MARAPGCRPLAALALLALALPAPAASAEAQPTPEPPAAAGVLSPPPGAAGETSFLVENVTRAELWRYFEPPPRAGTNADYVFVGNRATLGADYAGPRWSARGALQYVRLENLPAGAIGPGLLGNGGAYFFQAGLSFSYQFYLRSLSLTWRDRPLGVWVEGGRWSRAAATEVPSGEATIDRLVADELNGRLLGDVEWSFYQRAWDGLRAGWTRGGVSATLSAAVPTQGTFEESANLPMDRVRVAAAEVTVAPGALAPRTRVETFGIVYDDRRRVTARPDNANRLPERADIRVWTVGASAVGAYPSRWGTWDATAWVAAQSGQWYELSHGAVAATGALGHRFTGLRWRPWLRLGTAYASGDASPTDRRHGTFFPMLPSGDRVSRLNAYALMNVMDRSATLTVQPDAALDLSAGVRRVRLASNVDRWYQGSGATLRAGNYFGFQGRDGRGASTIGTVVEGGASWRPRRWWTIKAHVGRIAGGDVVARLFRGRRLISGWLESTVRF